jgi:hypothetical protein
MSLLEIIFAITLLAIISPILFGIFFANANLSKDLIAQRTMKENAEDVKSSIRLTDYASLCDVIENRESIGIEEVKEDGMIRSKLTKYGSVTERAARKFIAKFELVYVDDKATLTDVTETDILTLKCEIRQLKSDEQTHSPKKLAESFGAEYIMFITKNRSEQP